MADNHSTNIKVIEKALQEVQEDIIVISAVSMELTNRLHDSSTADSYEHLNEKEKEELGLVQQREGLTTYFSCLQLGLESARKKEAAKLSPDDKKRVDELFSKFR